MPSVAKPETKKYLIIPNIGMGDSLLSLGALFKVKTLFPASQTSVLCWGERWQDVYRELNYISRVITADPLFEAGSNPPVLVKESRKILADLINQHDVIISLCAIENIENIIKENKKPEEYYIWSSKDEPAPTYFESLSQGLNRYLGTSLNWHPLMSPAVSAVMAEQMRTWLVLNVKGRKLAVIAVAAGSPIRKIPIAIFLKVYIYLLNAGYMPVVIIPNDASKDYYVKFFEKYRIKSLEFAYLSDIFEFISVAGLYVGPDTGLSHFAALKNIPSVIIMGPSLQYFRPYGPKASAINFGEECEFQKKPCDAAGKCEYQENGAKCFKQFDTGDFESALAKIKIIEAF